MSKIRVIVVDDEPIARRHVERLLKPAGDVSVVASCGNGQAAIEAIIELQPDLVFLDVQMPGIDGFKVLEQLPRDRLPLVIFTTAFDQYAVKAFEIHAIDYLLKPFDDDRFHVALDRARKTLGGPKDQIVRKLEEIVESLSKREPQIDTSVAALERIVVQAAGKIQFVKTKEIERFKAAGQYIELRVGSREHLIRQTMDQMESDLDPRRFVRIHRSTIVNIDFIKEIEPWGRSQYAVTMKSGEQFISSRGYRHKLAGLVR